MVVYFPGQTRTQDVTDQLPEPADAFYDLVYLEKAHIKAVTMFSGQ